MLSIHLNQELKRVVNGLPSGLTYETIKHHLLMYIDPQETRSARRTEFMALTRNIHKQSPREFQMQLEEKALVAFPTATHEDLTDIIKEQFIQGHPAALRNNLSLQTFTDVSHVVGAVIRLESNVKANLSITPDVTTQTLATAEVTPEPEYYDPAVEYYDSQPYDSYCDTSAFSSAQPPRPPGPRLPHNQPSSYPRHPAPADQMVRVLAKLRDIETHLGIPRPPRRPMAPRSSFQPAPTRYPGPSFRPRPPITPRIASQIQTAYDCEQHFADPYATHNQISEDERDVFLYTTVALATEYDQAGHDGMAYLHTSIINRYQPQRSTNGPCWYCEIPGHFWMRCQKLHRVLNEHKALPKWNAYLNSRKSSQPPHQTANPPLADPPRLNHIEEASRDPTTDLDFLHSN